MTDADLHIPVTSDVPQVSILAVDLAAKYSAAVVLSSDGAVVDQFDSHVGEQLFLDWLDNAYVFNFLDQMVVEDLPHGVGYRSLVKRVCQIQGRIADRMDQRGKLDELLFVAPSTWRRHYPQLRKQNQGPDAVVPIAQEYGYQPPGLGHLNGPRGGRALADKIQTDYCAAFLIGRWALAARARRGTFDVPGTERYGEKTITKTEGSKTDA